MDRGLMKLPNGGNYFINKYRLNEIKFEFVTI
jgi:hypothetical protein